METNTSLNLSAPSVHRLVFLLAGEETEKVSSLLSEMKLGFEAWAPCPFQKLCL